MRLIFRLLVVLFLWIPFCVQAQLNKPAPKIPRILFLLDGSSSMTEDWNAKNTRLKEAGKFILTLMDSMSKANDQVQFGLRVFGHQYPAQQKYCYDTKREVAFSRDNAAQMAFRLESLHPYGVSPIAYSLSQAAEEDFENESKYAYSIVLVTDGGESCDGDLCKVVNDLLQRKIFFRPYIVSLVDYAPLREQYKCLGNFLTLTKESEVDKTVNKIVDAHREGFERAKTGTVIPVFSETVVPKTEQQKPAADTVKKITTAVQQKRKLTPVVYVWYASIRPIRFTKRVPVPYMVKVPPFIMSKWEEPAQPVVVNKPVIKADTVKKIIVTEGRKKTPVAFIKPRTRLTAFLVEYDLTPDPIFVKVPPFKMSGDYTDPITKTEPTATANSRMTVKEVVQRKPVVYTMLKNGNLKHLPILRVMPKPKTYPVPPFVLVSKPDPVVVSKPIVNPVKEIKPDPQQNKPQPVPYKVEVENAEATLLEVYFTDGMGKYYPSNPQIVLSDPKTGKQLHKFFRTTDADGVPDAQSIPAGTFDLSITGSSRTYIKDVTIVANKKNKIVITVGNGSLAFAYSGVGTHKPVSKYFAIVKRNFDPLPVVKQRCDTILPYPPGNYHIEVNTLPATAFSVDLNFGTLVELPIPEPGIIQISNTNNLGKVALFYPLGDKFVRFYTMNITGNVEQQQVEVKPGIYEAHYIVAPGLPEKVLTFHVYSNANTEIKLE